jgi:ATP-dependent DNA helicase PIF1
MSDSETLIHVGAERNVKNADGSMTKLTVNWSKIPVTCGDAYLNMVRETSDKFVNAALEDLELRAKGQIRPTSTVAQPFAERFDAAASKLDEAVASAAPKAPDFSVLEEEEAVRAEETSEPVAQKEEPDWEAPVPPASMTTIEEDIAPFMEMTSDPAPPVDRQEESPIPDESEVKVGAEAFGIYIPYPPIEWHDQSILHASESPNAALRDDDRGMQVALIASLEQLGFKDPNRKSACAAILEDYGWRRNELKSTNDLCRAEAHVILEWATRARSENVYKLWSKLGQEALAESKEIGEEIRAPSGPSQGDIDALIAAQERAEDALQAVATIAPVQATKSLRLSPEEIAAENERLKERASELGFPLGFKSGEQEEDKWIDDSDAGAALAECSSDEPSNLPAVVDRHGNELAITLSAEQQGAIQTCLDAMIFGPEVLFVTGKAGVGKSLVLNNLRPLKNLVVCAPTGLAAINVGGMTCHRVFRLPMGVAEPRKIGGVDTKMISVIRRADAIVFDEVSMMRCDMVDAIDLSLRKTMDAQEPFGGKTVIFIGDDMQLEPVLTQGAEEDWIKARYQSHFWFDAHVLGGKVLSGEKPARTASVKKIELTQIFRQTGEGANEFTEALNLVRRGDPTGLALINARAIPVPEGEHPVAVTFTRARADAINERRLRELPGEEKVYNAIIDGDFPEKEMPSPINLALKVGAQVMFNRNLMIDWVRVSNGTSGIVEELFEGYVSVSLDTGEVMKVHPEEWSKINYTFNRKDDRIEEKAVGTFKQLPLKMAFAITAHKSQGQSIDCVSIDPEKGSFAHGQLYVALSRCKNFNRMYLSRPLTAGDISVHQRVKEFVGIAGGKFDEEAFK